MFLIYNFIAFSGNSWGSENGQQGLGLGQQEEFYGCSDVSIRSSQGLDNGVESVPTSYTIHASLPFNSSDFAPASSHVPPSPTSTIANGQKTTVSERVTEKTETTTSMQISMTSETKRDIERPESKI